jgi:hypothetical protein
MRFILENIEAGNVSREIVRKGIAPQQRLRVVLETVDDDLPLAQIAEHGRAFEFLASEPNLYSASDIKR